MIIAVIGKGGVGKTTLSSLLVRKLIEAGETPVLAVDADPSSCLGSALGLPAGETLGDLRERFKDDPDRPTSVSRTEWLVQQVEEAVEEAKGFDLLTMGRPEGPGCYCAVNSLLRDHLDRLGRSYRHVLLDCEAGLEHLSRRTGGRPDRLVCVTNRSRMGAETVQRALGLYRELHNRLPSRTDLVLNGFETDEPLAGKLAEVAGGRTGRQSPFTRIWTVPVDPAVSSFEAMGRPLLELDPSSPALSALDGWEEEA